jgi:hypothetical protein
MDCMGSRSLSWGKLPLAVSWGKLPLAISLWASPIGASLWPALGAVQPVFAL